MPKDRGYIIRISGKNIRYQSYTGDKTINVTLPATPEVIDQALELRQKPQPFGLIFTIEKGKIHKVEHAKSKEIW